ncbi:OLC1v1005338C1 [Oldenlandia corymbosa var. corymbosa]|uniref:Probable magnesium transporter n=1 Tax=Oldenlandia corymbosa var. corymbosa TaxID=529605 RepID=A0AAV1DH32_OLDCO|nr:OLC1v1005338C1 [Oldenlandia corymbosa var. corymbosa]
MGFSTDNLTGFILALLSTGFIGASFIIKKKGLRRAAAASGVRAGVGGHSYLLEPLWWLGLITMIVGEVANFVAYAFAPAVLVTPLGALSIIVSAVLAHFILKERLHQLGVLGCVMCIAGSVIIVIHAPQEQSISSVQEIWNIATQPAFLMYVGSVVVLVFILVFYFAPQYGHTNVLVFTAICSLMGSLSVMSVKAVGTAMKLTFEGRNQLIYPETWFFMIVVAVSVITQMNYLNKLSIHLGNVTCRIGMVKVLAASYQKFVALLSFSQVPSYYMSRRTLREARHSEATTRLCHLHCLLAYVVQMGNY